MGHHSRTYCTEYIAVARSHSPGFDLHTDAGVVQSQPLDGAAQVRYLRLVHRVHTGVHLGTGVPGTGPSSTHRRAPGGTNTQVHTLTKSWTKTELVELLL